MLINMKEGYSFNQTSMTLKNPQTSTNEQWNANVHTKVQCQQQQLQHVLLQRNRHQLQTGR